MAVSVSVITYNQAAFIKQTLRAILGQVVDFPVTIYVSDDASDDDTVAIVRDLMREFPGRLSLNVNAERVGMGENFLSNIHRCADEFVAVCDGDDLWTDPNKLQKQIDGLLANPRYSMACHASRLVNWRGEVLGIIPNRQTIRTCNLTQMDLAKRESFFATSSIVFRSKALFPIPDWFAELEDQIDYPLNFHCAGRGNIWYSPEPMSLYRSGSSPSAYSSQPNSQILEREIRMFRTIRQHAPPEFDGDFAQIMQRKESLRVLWSLIDDDASFFGADIDLAARENLALRRGGRWEKIVTDTSFAIKRWLPRRIRLYVFRNLAARIERGSSDCA